MNRKWVDEYIYWCREIPMLLMVLLVNTLGVSVLPLLIFGAVALLTMVGNK